MPNNLEDYLYDEDIFGTDIHNKITNELHLVTAGAEISDFNFIVPKMMPYFKESMVVRHVSTNRILVPGVDWQPGHIFESATFETEWVLGGIYGSILIMDRNLVGQFELVSYQTLGGEWVLENTKLLELLSNRIQDPRSATYESLSGKPNVFPPTGHNHPIQDWVGMNEMVSALGQVSQSIDDRTDFMMRMFPGLMAQYYTKIETVQQINGIVQTTVNQVVEDKVGAQMVALNAALNQHIENTSSAIADRFTKNESDNRYYKKTESYSQTEVDSKVAAVRNDTYTKAEADSRYFNKTETYNRSQQDGRYRQLIAGNAKVYVTSLGGEQSNLEYTNSPTKNTIVYRDNNGRTRVADGVDSKDAVNKGQYDALADSTVAGLNDRFTKSESDNRFRQRLANTVKSHVYTHDINGNEASVQYSNVTTNNTIVQRTAAGTIRAAKPTAVDDVVTKEYNEDNFRSRLATTVKSAVYVNDGSGAQSSIPYSSAADGNSIARRTAEGRLATAAPAADTDATNKKYVEDNFRSRLSTAIKSQVYINNASGAQAGIAYTSEATRDTFPLRDAGSTFKVGVATDDAHPLRKKEFNEGMASLSSAVGGSLNDRYTKTESDARYRQLVAGNSQVYVTNASGNQSSISHSASPTNNSIAVRTGSGTLRVKAPTDNEDAVNKKYNEDNFRSRLPATTKSTVYTNDDTGAQTGITYSDEANASTIPLRDGSGRVRTAAPTGDNDAVNKKYGTDTYRARLANTVKSVVYTHDANGAESSIVYSDEANASTIAYRGAGGVLSVGTPTAAAHATTKKYVDDGTTALGSAIATLGGDRYTKSESDLRYRQLQANASHVYATNASKQQTSVQYTSAASANSIAQRDGNGRLGVGTPSDDDHAATKQYVDSVSTALSGLKSDLSEGGGVNKVHWNNLSNVPEIASTWDMISNKPTEFPPVRSTATVDGGVRTRLDGNVLYMTNNGNNA